ncbi:MAG: hypothetical protein HY828_12075 [Actinobacteria bacterium]|nr:hypothetical protein [Actinomycetota bacterium]
MQERTNRTHRAVGTILVLAIGALLATGCSSSSSSSTSSSGEPRGTVVHISITDHTAVDKPMSFTIDRTSVPAGDVTFVVTNDGNIDHELVVLRTDTPYDSIPVNAAGDPPAVVASGANKILEDGNVGETGDPDLAKGTTRTFTIADMQAGSYVLVCNLALHYQMGLRSPFTVS